MLLNVTEKQAKLFAKMLEEVVVRKIIKSIKIN